MFISKFNRYFARHGRWTYALLGIIIALSFVVFVTPGERGGGMGPDRRDIEIGTMYGRSIDSKEFFRNLHAADVTLFLRIGRFFGEDDRMFPFLVDEALRRMRAVREARTRGLDKVSDEQVAKAIRDQRMLHQDGTFSLELFSMFKDNMLSRRGIDGKAFDQIIRENIMIERLEQIVGASVFVAPAEIREAFDHENERFTIRHYEFRYHELLKDPALEPAEEDILACFETHRSEFPLPDQKRIRVTAIPREQFMDEVEVNEAEVKSHYERVRKRLYDPKGQSIEDVKDDIDRSLRQRKAGSKADAEAKALVAKLQEVRKDQPDEMPASLFAQVVEEAGFKFVDTVPFTAETKEFPDLGAHAILARRGYELTEDNPFSTSIYDGGTYFVACWLETIPGGVPEELTDTIRPDVIDRLLTDEAREFYNENLAEFGVQIEQGLGPDEIRAEYAERLEARVDVSADEKERLRKDHEDRIKDYLQVYYVPEQRKARVLTFSPTAYRAMAEVTDEQVRAHYEAHRTDTYGKEEVRAHILVLNFPPQADEKQKHTTRERMTKVLDEVREGRDFTELVQLHSEDQATRPKGGDTGYFARGTHPRQVEAALFSPQMQQGQFSSVIETDTGLYLAKFEGRRKGQPFEEVSAQIRQELLEQQAGRLAEQAAASFVQKLYDAWDRAQASEADPVAAEVFAEIAAGAQLHAQDTDWFREHGVVAPLGWQPELSNAAYRLNQSNPISSIIKGKQDMYAACWMDTKPAYLPVFDEEPRFPQRVKRHLQREKATAIVRERARTTREKIIAQLAEGMSFEEAAADIRFAEAVEFTRQSPPTGIPNAADIAALVSEQRSGNLLEPVNTGTGSLLVYLEERQLPAEEEFKEREEMVAMQILNKKQGNALRALYERLEKESNTQLAERWQRGA